MNRPAPIRRLLAALLRRLLAALLITSVMPAGAQVETQLGTQKDAQEAALAVDQTVAQARSLILAGQPREALAALDEPPKGAGVQPNFELLALRGAAWQLLARLPTAGSNASGLSTAEQAAARQRASAAYQQALAQQPTSAAVLSNLAQIAADDGDDAQARAWWDRAVASTDTRRADAALAYARYLQRRDPAAAVAQARTALAASRDGSQVRPFLATLLAASSDPATLPRFLNDTLAQGHSGFVVSTALEQLQATPPLPNPVREALLVVIARALAADAVVVAQGPDAALRAALTALADDAALGAGARQLLDVLAEPPSGVAVLGWWRNNVPLPANLGSRQAALRSLLLALGQTQVSADPRRAEGWLRAAVDLGERGPDPDAFLRLVELFVNSGRAEALGPLMSRYEGEMFNEKGGAYSRGDWPLAFRMHLALGMTYAHLNTWRSTGPFQNAVFQLEAARRAAGRANSQRPPADRLALPPVAVSQLSRAYAATGRNGEVTALKISAAEELRAAQRPADTAQVLQTIEPAELRRLDRPALDRIERLRVPTLSTVPN